MRLRLPLLTVLMVVATGCIPTGPDVDCESPSVRVELSLSGEALDPASPAVCRDQEVALVVQSDVDGVLHIHGYDSEVPAFEVRAGEQADISFVAGRSGQFPVEFHAMDDPRGVEVGIFTVHEP